MFWLIRKIFHIGILLAFAYLVIHIQVGGIPIRDHIKNLFESPLLKEGTRQISSIMEELIPAEYWPSELLRESKKTPPPPPPGLIGKEPPMEKIEEHEARELEIIIRRKTNPVK